MVSFRIGLDKNLFPPYCRAWLERVEPTQQAANKVVVLPDSPAGEFQEAFGGMMRQIRYRVFCTKFASHDGQHRFQVGYDVLIGRKKVAKKNGG